MARRSTFEKVGLFDTNYKIASDVDWFLRAADLQIPMHTIERVHLRKRIHAHNLSADAAQNTKELFKIIYQSLIGPKASCNCISDA